VPQDDDDVSDDDATDDDDSDTDDDDTTGIPDDDDDDDDTAPVEVTPGAVLFSEVMYDPAAAADTDGEWFELHNTTGDDLDVGGCVLSDLSGDEHTIAGPLVVPALGYLTLGIAASTSINGGVDVDYEYAGINLRNSDSDQLLLTCTEEVDRVEWALPGWPGDAGVAMNFDVTYAPDNDDVSHWCDASTQMANDDWGTPGAPNDACGGGSTTIEADDLVITEVMANPQNGAADEDGEWFELLNRTGDALNLAGCVISDDGTDSVTISGAVMIAAGGRVVLGNNADPATNGGVTVDYDYGTGFSLGNGEDELVVDCDGEIDRIAWDDGATWPEPAGASMNLDEAYLLENEDGSHWCAATTPLGTGDFGTPGAVNDPC